MKIKEEFKLEKVASTDPTRFVINNILIKDGKAVATNGRSLVIAKVEMEDGDKDGFLPPKALIHSRKLSRHLRGLIVLNGDGKEARTLDGVSFPREQEGHFPEYEQILPKKDAKIEYEITLDPTLLLKLAQAMGSEDRITLKFHGQTNAMSVSVQNQDVQGVMMPMKPW